MALQLFSPTAAATTAAATAAVVDVDGFTRCCHSDVDFAFLLAPESYRAVCVFELVRFMFCVVPVMHFCCVLYSSGVFVSAQ